MKIQKEILKNRISKSKPDEILALQIKSLEKDSLKICQKEIGNFTKKSEDYIVVVMKN